MLSCPSLAPSRAREYSYKAASTPVRPLFPLDRKAHSFCRLPTATTVVVIRNRSKTCQMATYADVFSVSRRNDGWSPTLGKSCQALTQTRFGALTVCRKATCNSSPCLRCAYSCEKQQQSLLKLRRNAGIGIWLGRCAESKNDDNNLNYCF
ncbi:hypothetical protein L917_16759 [Phytophthora nicotianae]|uniref:Uncharacterized protein n=2 Tax=Phytophthora nicotianae TaxID=4792 RepID=W2KDQ6_PHYNI|nr:hypothetical protein L917_16759 [Phytophthora nicotianae]ETO65104.1 hypothetical protein F444_17541 [Phytophthora nicotianae P1976]